ncbi:MAG: lysine 5,6-aminomutase subunit alpha, partial [Minicystis sp.]
MATVPMDPSLVAECRAFAGDIADDVQRFIDRHTTVGVERTVARAYGVVGADAEGTPLANKLVDRLHARKLTGRGVAYFLGSALVAGAGSVQEAAEALAFGDALDEGEGAGATTAAARGALERATREAVDRIDHARDARVSFKAQHKVGETPLRYVIVATGNIYDDVDQARAAAQAGADVIAVIRSTAQSLLDYVPHGATTEGYGGTYATQENFRIMREALDEESRKLKRYVQLTNYSSGLCMAEIAFCAAYEKLDMLLNDAMYGILFRDINLRRTFIDQYFSRRICALSGIIINTGEDNYITTADAYDAAHTVIASQFINECFAKRAGLADWQLGLGHSYEIDPHRPDTLLLELSQAMLIRRCFPDAPLKYMPPTKHKQTDIFFSHAYDVMADLVAVWTRQGIQLLGMMTEAMHTPLLADRYVALK